MVHRKNKFETALSPRRRQVFGLGAAILGPVAGISLFLLAQHDATAFEQENGPGQGASLAQEAIVATEALGGAFLSGAGTIWGGFVAARARGELQELKRSAEQPPQPDTPSEA